MSATGLGVVTGLIIGIVVAIIVVKACNKNGRFKTDYDERQEAIRGRGFKYAAFTTWIMMCICGVLEICEIDIHMDNSIKFFTIIFIGILVSVSHSIWKDAYFGGNNSIRKYALAFTIITLINVLVAVMMIVKKEMVVDGVLTEKAVNLECALMFVAIAVQYAIKAIVDKSHEQGDE